MSVDELLAGKKHVVCHLGNKPYRCIVDNCGMKFASQVMLNRHVNKHFAANLAQGKNTKSFSNGNGKGGRSRNGTSSAGDNNDSGAKPQRKRRSRKIKTRQAPSAVQRDLFDSLTMNCIQKYLVNFSKRTQVQQTSSGQIITFRSEVIGYRTDANNVRWSLICWSPSHIIPDEWVKDSELTSKQTQAIPLSHLSGDAIKYFMCHQD
ncbi:hypothetical protein HELRODRAFT_159438 [Helobdella robusta]|uniref:C2H2-type domain-containing protein n=1 Tax=Helobdella robusta TaxID=6412 RepID=T1EP13_HELRO|nr:hypothetical protein HELRODRAFT_159438 [Helobdella robusta]ESO12850.1 hypothetical protein HELRODRAFT_159438 [Helobdella robusta]